MSFFRAPKIVKWGRTDLLWVAEAFVMLMCHSAESTGGEKAHIKLCFQLFLAQQKITKKCSLLNIQTFCRHSWKLNYVNSHLARFILSIQRKEGLGRGCVKRSSCTGCANWMWQQNLSLCGRSSGASFVAGFSIGLTHFDSFPLSTFLTRIHLSRVRKRSCRALASAKACDICECTLQCGQAELKQLIGTRHASSMSSLTR